MIALMTSIATCAILGALLVFGGPKGERGEGPLSRTLDAGEYDWEYRNEEDSGTRGEDYRRNDSYGSVTESKSAVLPPRKEECPGLGSSQIMASKADSDNASIFSDVEDGLLPPPLPVR